MSWPTHGDRGRHDWATYLERGYVDPFRDTVRGMQDVDASFDGPGRTMLMVVLTYARGEAWIEIVNLLLGAGADVNRRDASNRPVWDYAPTSGPACLEMWRILLRAGMDINTRGPKNETALLRLCSVYSTDYSDITALVKLLLTAGADVNVEDQYRTTPLQAAAGNGNPEAVKLLIKAGARLTLSGSAGRSPLHEAALKGHAGVAQALLHAGVAVDPVMSSSRIRSFPVFTSGYVDVEGVTPLIAAAEGGYLPVVRMLVNAGADVNHADSGGFTALMGAARTGHAQMAKFLLDRGARLDAVDASGRNARKHAEEFKHLREIDPVLRQARGKVGSGNLS